MLIRFTGKHEKEPTRGYLPWLASMLSEAGFDFPKTELVERLSCSEKMVQIIQKHVDYIRIRDSRLSAGMLSTSISPNPAWRDAAAILAEDFHASTYYNRRQLMRYLIDTPTYTKQTKRVPLEEAFRGDVEAITAYRALDERLEKAYKTLKPDAFEKVKMQILEAQSELLDKHCPECHDTIFNKTHRTAVEAVPVPPFNWFDADPERGHFISAADAIHTKQYRNTEMLYRDMFLSCATKITFGQNKTFFWIPEDEEGFIVPMTF